jgi:hypothetical protein
VPSHSLTIPLCPTSIAGVRHGEAATNTCPRPCPPGTTAPCCFCSLRAKPARPTSPQNPAVHAKMRRKSPLAPEPARTYVGPRLWTPPCPTTSAYKRHLGSRQGTLPTPTNLPDNLS